MHNSYPLVHNACSPHVALLHSHPQNIANKQDIFFRKFDSQKKKKKILQFCQFKLQSKILFVNKNNNNLKYFKAYNQLIRAWAYYQLIRTYAYYNVIRHELIHTFLKYNYMFLFLLKQHKPNCQTIWHYTFSFTYFILYVWHITIEILKAQEKTLAY